MRAMASSGGYGEAADPGPFIDDHAGGLDLIQ
jgi:hypothetical protein